MFSHQENPSSGREFRRRCRAVRLWCTHHSLHPCASLRLDVLPESARRAGREPGGCRAECVSSHLHTLLRPSPARSEGITHRSPHDSLSACTRPTNAVKGWMQAIVPGAAQSTLMVRRTLLGGLRRRRTPLRQFAPRPRALRQLRHGMVSSCDPRAGHRGGVRRRELSAALDGNGHDDAFRKRQAHYPRPHGGGDGGAGATRRNVVMRPAGAPATTAGRLPRAPCVSSPSSSPPLRWKNFDTRSIRRLPADISSTAGAIRMEPAGVINKQQRGDD